MHHSWERLCPLLCVRHRLAPFPLLFAPRSTDIREWSVEIDPPGTTLYPPLPTGGKLAVSLHRLLIECGLALTSATSSWDSRSWFALYKYGGDFTGTAPSLRFFSGFNGKDPRLKAIASEEVATGIACYILREHFGVTHIADVYACIQRKELEYVDATSGCRPDFFCQDQNGETILVECKGAIGTPCSITNQIAEGWNQVQNVRPINLILRQSCNRVVIGTSFCIQGEHPRSETTTLIKDPEGLDSHQRNPNSDMLMRLAYAKLLRFAGQDVLADAIILRRNFSSLINISPDIDLPTVRQIPLLPLGRTPWGDVIGLFGPTAKALFSQKEYYLRAAVSESLLGLMSQQNNLGDAGYVLPDGTIIIHDEKELDR